MSIVSQGGRANSNGRAAEDVIAGILTQRGVQYDRQCRVGFGIFESVLRVDFYCYSAPGFPTGLIIESKWQEVGGSADEKLPFLVANIRDRYPCPVIVIAGGGPKGMRAGAVAWLRNQVAITTNLYAVFSLEEFLTWANRSL